MDLTMKHKIIILCALLLVGGIALLFWLGLPSVLKNNYFNKNKVSTTEAISGDNSDQDKVESDSINNNNCNCEILNFLMDDSLPVMREVTLKSGRFFKMVKMDYYSIAKEHLTEISVEFIDDMAVVFPLDAVGAGIGGVRTPNHGDGDILIYRRVKKNKWKLIDSFYGMGLTVSKYSAMNQPILAELKQDWSGGGDVTLYAWDDNSEKYDAFMSARFYFNVFSDALNYSDCTMLEK